MSNRPVSIALLAGAYCLLNESPAPAQLTKSEQATSSVSLAACQPVWSIARTLVFAGRSPRAQRIADAAWWIGARVMLDDMRSPTTEQSGGTKPSPLPVSVTVRKPATLSEIAVLQRTYRALVRLGLHEEAAEVAKQIASPVAMDDEPSQIVPAVAAENASTNGSIQQASFVRPVAEARGVVTRQPINVQFVGASLIEAARVISAQTGCVIGVHQGLAPVPKIYFSCRNLPADEALQRIAEGCGWIVQPTANGIALAPPLAVPLRDARLPILR